MDIDYEPLPAVVDTESAVAPDSPCVYPESGHNVTLSSSHPLGDADAAIAAADVVVRDTFLVQRYSCIPGECRGIVAEPHGRSSGDDLERYSVPHLSSAPGRRPGLASQPHSRWRRTSAEVWRKASSYPETF